MKNNLPYYLKNLSDVESITIYKNDIVLNRSMPSSKRRGTRGGKREKVEGFSSKSWKRLAFVASNTDVEFRIMATLTYPDSYPTSGKETKKHLNRLLSAIRGKFKGVQYLWFMEFQERGAPHYHILLDVPFLDCVWLATRWYDAVESEDMRHLEAGVNVEAIREKKGARNYCVVYSTKMRQKEVPPHVRDCGRFWGHSRGVKPVPREEKIVYGLDSLLDSMGEWEYKENVRGKIVKVLYNASSFV